MSRAARYLVRFDDICPAMNWDMWGKIETVLRENGVKPILAVVPDNKDPLLDVGAPVSDFWERVRGWQGEGWTIALHGYQHIYQNKLSGLMKISNKSEFAGLPLAVQEENLRKGVEIFRQNGVHTNVWVAPSHSFDENTLTALRNVGVNIVSDGLGVLPHGSLDTTYWIPQQMWGAFYERKSGVWTVCYHHNDWQEKDLKRFTQFIEAYSDRMTSVDEVACDYPARAFSIADAINTQRVRWRLFVLPQIKRIVRGKR
ncbi:hypothetical protein LBMAG21_11610 [Armatimonadota bacterium]|nr:hypothetical protein LBMAG21_11610 [Armatimonadota bacterium]